jgi:hypothetical protein
MAIHAAREPEQDRFGRLGFKDRETPDFLEDRVEKAKTCIVISFRFLA